MINSNNQNPKKFLKLIDWTLSSSENKKEALLRPKSTQDLKVKNVVTEILTEVQRFGDQALKDLSLKFDGVEVQDLKITDDEMQLAYKNTDPLLLEALNVAIDNLKKFHLAQKTNPVVVSTMKGVVCEKRNVPIQNVGLYIPGGTAPLPSTLMMLAVPALIAGCENIIVVTPPIKTSTSSSQVRKATNTVSEDSPTVTPSLQDSPATIPDVILATAYLLGLKNIFKVGGAQAIGALAFGTESVPKVDKIFGPGNAYVTEAKMQVAYDPSGAAIDMPAGPSEVLVIADEYADPEFVASDLLSQAEHDKMSQVILVSTSKSLINEVERQLDLQLEVLPRKEIALSALKSSRAILCDDLLTAMDISNNYAPEHLIVHVQDLKLAKSKIKNAGSVFLGPWSPESVGDYASGTNHVLPTYGFAKAFSGVGLESFTKSISFQELSAEGLNLLGPFVERLASAEGLEAHRNAVRVRLKKSGVHL